MCPECGGPYVYGGSDRHYRCREIARKRQEREYRMDALLEMFEQDIDRYLERNV